jgi:hypothetical protein
VVNDPIKAEAELRNAKQFEALKRMMLRLLDDPHVQKKSSRFAARAKFPVKNYIGPSTKPVSQNASVRVHRDLTLIHGREMEQKSRDVLEAADKWLTVIEAMDLAENTRSETEALEEELYEAEGDLRSAIKAWRVAGGRQRGYN